MPTYTKETHVHWNTESDQYDNQDFDNERADFITLKVFEDKTDGVGIIVSPTETHRKWVDAPAAQEFIDFLTTIAEQKYGLNIISKQIVDAE